MKTYDFTAYVEKDSETELYYGYIPNLPGAHSQGNTLDELYKNLQEVTELCLAELSDKEIEQALSKYIGTQQVTVAR
jgi:predicted RNase H-like HicB family nuclease